MLQLRSWPLLHIAPPSVQMWPRAAKTWLQIENSRSLRRRVRLLKCFCRLNRPLLQPFQSTLSPASPTPPMAPAASLTQLLPIWQSLRPEAKLQRSEEKPKTSRRRASPLHSHAWTLLAIRAVLTAMHAIAPSERTRMQWMVVCRLALAWMLLLRTMSENIQLGASSTRLLEEGHWQRTPRQGGASSSGRTCPMMRRTFPACRS
mmetsp:Transcript_145709/g.254242  ORF Transcript_145709/g.254242 Transcript_145709/m.254242 type:complete len:204 (+) Transcript_145709:98-709(+)